MANFRRPMKRLRLTDNEKTVMEILWKSGRHLSVYDVLELYEDPKPAYTTVSTTISRMLHKGIVDYSKGKGKTYYYYPKISKAAYCYEQSHGKDGVRRLILLIVCIMFAFFVAAVCIRQLSLLLNIGEPKPERIEDKEGQDRRRKATAQASPVTAYGSTAQPKASQADDSYAMRSIETNVDQLPEYPYDIATLQAFIQKYFTEKYSGRCYAQVLIDENGKMIDITFIGRSIPHVRKEELLDSSKIWTPARKNGKSVATHIIIPLNYTENEN